ncbi:unnamed protein product [Phaedon cochleariae]|uniref:Uncharacterized protein n=1 Tax=Phaedon cochleariae TaxID=80249 RepID=A0A9N9X3J0_PHACE|nr:unnamed protein product [Phaedon cochleariae]
MVCRKLLDKGIQIHPLGIILIILGCAIAVTVHNAALMKGAEGGEDEKKGEEGDKKEGDKGDKKEGGEEGKEGEGAEGGDEEGNEEGGEEGGEAEEEAEG